MKMSKLVSVSLVAMLSVTSATSARADGNGLVGGLVGGIIGGAIAADMARHSRQNTTNHRATTQRSSANTAQRQANRETQTALNHFGFDAGAPDGVMGRRSRAAITQYQVTLGYPPTGQLTEFERNHLVSSYHRAVAGGALTMQQAAANPMGMKGLLVEWRDATLGLPPGGGMAAGTMAAGTMAAGAAAAGTLGVLNKQPSPEGAEPPAAASVPAATAPALPNFLGGMTTQASLASHCNRVNLVTSSNGGFVTAASMTDPNQALGEQFCLARTYAITQGEELVARIQGVSADEIARQCEGFGTALRDHVAALSLQDRAAVSAGVASFVLASGMAPAQLTDTAKICLSVGYRTDNMDTAIGSALVLDALGEKVYDELLGHHLAMGFGTSRRPDLALAWYQGGIDALGQGGGAVFAPGQPERTELIRRAAYTLSGRADLLQPAAPVPAALPNFAPMAPAPAAPAAVAPQVQGALTPAPSAPATAEISAPAAPAPSPATVTAASSQPVGVASGMANILRLPGALLRP
ncbi:peptidoglycan-binding domain-containing protein [Phaeovulum vinaykumarii]|uniref:Putative peptidoglycan binding domain-containing protein n=1 Tax=Phaeovulum vinaykumarii TaxID=407234 RepID=A0A1N7L668_9RHOB|nr:peptidoglycan-binding domain-containing protein [Phaeovulum vinaykumarii]SIS69291.1 Putative peptidoglycan binding domain-containing protein [Phaeovulum vinaykumarii]SOB99558.1 putative peptidoglycan binding protein [Phaeovulum vinaykumarii]